MTSWHYGFENNFNIFYSFYSFQRIHFQFQNIQNQVEYP